jgi:two-component system CheB/CheR fusion protein
LVVEDDPLVRTALVDAMENWGMLVEAAGSAVEAVEVVRGAERLFDVVVSDFGLPGSTDGVGLICALRDELGQHIPAIILSGQVPSIDPSRLQKIDARALAKPVDPRCLKAELETCISPLQLTR